MNQVMLSVHCASLLDKVEKFRAFLVSHGYTVFLCNQMAGGVNYRAQISENATYCKVFVAFMNEGWCKSKECEFEFNIALSVHLETPNRIPYIIPILLEPFAVYSQYPAIRGFLRNCNGTMGNINEMDDKLWNTILAIIQKQIAPLNPSPSLSSSTSALSSSSSPALSSSSSSVPPASPSQESARASPLVNPYSQPAASSSGRSNLLPDVRNSPGGRSQGPRGARTDSKGGAESLTATALQLIEEITDFRITGTRTLLMNLTLVKTSLEKTTNPQDETSLRALMDCLCKIKETCVAVQYSSKEYPVNDKTYDTALKFAALLENPAISANLPIRDFFQEPNVGMFWERNFKGEFSVSWEKFEKALLSDATYRQYVNHETVGDLRMRIDHYNTGFVVCHRLADFVGSDTFANALQRYRDNCAINARVPDLNSSTGAEGPITYPLLLWVDDNPDGNDFIIEYAKMSNVNVILARSTAEAKNWLVRHSNVLDETDLNKFHIITDNVRQGANTALDLNAGEDLIRFVRGRRSPVPILVYCNDPTYAQYTSKYKNCKVATKGSQCQQFVDELIRANARPPAKR